MLKILRKIKEFFVSLFSSSEVDSDTFYANTGMQKSTKKVCDHNLFVHEQQQQYNSYCTTLYKYDTVIKYHEDSLEVDIIIKKEEKEEKGDMQKIRHFIFFNYCPFCGDKFRDDAKQKNAEIRETCVRYRLEEKSHGEWIISIRYGSVYQSSFKLKDIPVNFHPLDGNLLN